MSGSIATRLALISTVLTVVGVTSYAAKWYLQRRRDFVSQITRTKYVTSALYLEKIIQQRRRSATRVLKSSWTKILLYVKKKKAIQDTAARLIQLVWHKYINARRYSLLRSCTLWRRPSLPQLAQSKNTLSCFINIPELLDQVILPLGDSITPWESELQDILGAISLPEHTLCFKAGIILKWVAWNKRMIVDFSTTTFHSIECELMIFRDHGGNWKTWFTIRIIYKFLAQSLLEQTRINNAQEIQVVVLIERPKKQVKLNCRLSWFQAATFERRPQRFSLHGSAVLDRQPQQLKSPKLNAHPKFYHLSKFNGDFMIVVTNIKVGMSGSNDLKAITGLVLKNSRLQRPCKILWDAAMNTPAFITFVPSQFKVLFSSSLNKYSKTRQLALASKCISHIQLVTTMQKHKGQLQNTTLAAQKIQLFWRHSLTKRRRLQQAVSSAITIQRLWKQYQCRIQRLEQEEHFHVEQANTACSQSDQNAKPSLFAYIRTTILSVFSQAPIKYKGKGFIVRGLVGIMNNGNTCYINTLIQCLANIKPLQDLLSPQVYRNDGVLNALLKVLHQLWTSAPYSQIGVEALQSLLMHIKLASNRQFASGQQEDVMELFDFFLGRTEHSSDISSLFVGYTTSSITCHNCRFSWTPEASAFEVFKHLIIRFPERRDVRRCCFIDWKPFYSLDELLELNQAESKLDQFYCSRCNADQCFSSTHIVEYPKVLVLQLARFDESMKKMDRVNFPLKLKTKTTRFASIPIQYLLVGVAHHLSTSPRNGHYFADCKNTTDGNWYRFNDGNVSLRTSRFGSDDQQTAYVLFYTIEETI